MELPIAMWFNSAERHPPFYLATVVVILIIVVVVRVGSGSDWATARLITRTAHADLPLVLPQSVLAGVVAAAGDAKNLSILLSLSLPQGEIWVPALVIFSIPIPSRSTLSPSEPWISIFHWCKPNSGDTTSIILLIFSNINLVIVIHVTNIHRDVLSVADLGKLPVCHLILGGPDQVIPVTVLHDSVTSEQMERVPGAWIEEQTATQ